MKKNLAQSLKCPECSSKNIDIKLKEKEGEEEYIYNNPITKIRSQSYICKCRDCGHEYEFHYGYEKQILPFRPFPANGLNDVKILSTYESDSPLAKNYKLVTVENSIYGENQEEKALAYLLFIEGEDFPVLLTEEKTEELKKEPNKVLTLIKDTCSKRNQ